MRTAKDLISLFEDSRIVWKSPQEFWDEVVDFKQNSFSQDRKINVGGTPLYSFGDKLYRGKLSRNRETGEFSLRFAVTDGTTHRVPVTGKIQVLVKASPSDTQEFPAVVPDNLVRS
jgi:hypothetical protein